MNWTQLDSPTQVGLVATVLAVFGVLIPPLSVLFAAVAIVFCAAAMFRSRRSGERNRVAAISLAVSTALIVLLVVGNLVYAANN